MVNPGRRSALGALAALAACAADPPAAPARQAAVGMPTRGASLTGGFVAPALPLAAPPAAGRTGMYVRWIAPVAVAMKRGDLLVLDGASGRLWRAELASGLITGIPVGPMPGGTALQIGADLSAWVLDAAARQVLHVGRDGRVRQTLNLPPTMLTPVAMALDDDGVTLRLADGMGARWIEQRVGGPARERRPERADGTPLHGVDGFAPGPAGRLYVLDRLDGLVHVTDDAGHVLLTLGHGELLQPVAIAADRLGRAYVHDAQDASIKRLAPGQPVQRWSAESLGLQRIGAIAVDDLELAVADPLAGRVALFSFRHEATA